MLFAVIAAFTIGLQIGYCNRPMVLDLFRSGSIDDALLGSLKEGVDTL